MPPMPGVYDYDAQDEWRHTPDASHEPYAHDTTDEPYDFLPADTPAPPPWPDAPKPP